MMLKLELEQRDTKSIPNHPIYNHSLMPLTLSIGLTNGIYLLIPKPLYISIIVTLGQSLSSHSSHFVLMSLFRYESLICFG